MSDTTPEWGEFVGDTRPARESIEKRLREHPLLAKATGFLNGIGKGESAPHDPVTLELRPYWVLVFGSPGRNAVGSQGVVEASKDMKPLVFRVLCYAEKRDLSNLNDRVSAALIDFEPKNCGPIYPRFGMVVENPTVLTANQPRDGLATIFSCQSGIEHPNNV